MPAVDNITNDAEFIMSNVQPGGGITENTAGGRNQVHPYFGSYAGIGLCAASLYESDGRYLDAAWNFMDFLKMRARSGTLAANTAPGTFISDITWDPKGKTYTSLTTADSVDAYCSLFILFAYALTVASGDRYRNRILGLRTYLEYAWQSLVNTYNLAIHSTVTFPGQVLGSSMFSEDNAEAQCAMQALMLLKEQYFDDSFAKAGFTGGVENMQADHLNNFAANFYHAGSGTWSVYNGSGAANLAVSYPDAQAQMLVGSLLPSAMNANTVANLNTISGNFPNLYQASDAVWGVMAMQRAGLLKAGRLLMTATGNYEISNNRPFLAGTWITGDIGRLIVARTNAVTTFFPSTAT